MAYDQVQIVLDRWPHQPQVTACDTIDEDTVIASVPHDYKITLDGGHVREFKAGVQRMPRHIAEHWWSKSGHGVTIFEG